MRSPWICFSCRHDEWKYFKSEREYEAHLWSDHGANMNAAILQSLLEYGQPRDPLQEECPLCRKGFSQIESETSQSPPISKSSASGRPEAPCDTIHAHILQHLEELIEKCKFHILQKTR